MGSGSSGESKCQECHKVLFKPVKCRRCGGIFCSAHASPRSHACVSKPTAGRVALPRRKLLAVAILCSLAICLVALLPSFLGGRTGPTPSGHWTGTIRFEDVTLEAGLGVTASGHGLGVEDLDGDLDYDLYIVNKDGNLFYRNNGDGTFTDVTALTGVGKGPGGGHGVAMGDYDNDGDRDVFCANWLGTSGGRNVLYRNEGNFTFKDVTLSADMQVGGASQSHSACMGDYNGDGWLDIIATNVGGMNYYFQNRRDGRFLYTTDLGAGDAPHGLNSADYDLDGDLDVYLSNQEWQGKPASNVFYENTGNGFTRIANSAGLRGQTHCSFFGDFDGDGDYDFFGVDKDSAGAKAYYRNVGKRFKEVSSQVGAFGPENLVHGMDCADFDFDGDLDVLLTAAGKTVLLANRGDGTFEDITAKVGLDIDFGDPKAVCFFDYDGDGDLDIYVVVAGGQNRLFRSTGNANNWIRVNLQGTESNRDGIGARLELVAGDLRQFREVPAGRGHIHDPIEQAFGLGSRDKVDMLRITWPSGKIQEVGPLPANSRVRVVEGGGWSILE